MGESFETNNTVELSNADGVSGIRQVEMLGLAGKYVLMTRDNIPLLRGFSLLNGLNQIPGPMVSSVSIAKGAGSVSSGFEGITGGLNYGLKSDVKDPRLFVNFYANSQQRTEGNAIWKQKTGKHSFNDVYLHYGMQNHITDKGKDSMADQPRFNRVFLGDQFHYSGKKTEGMIGGIYIKEDRYGGDFQALKNKDITNRFLFNLKEEKMEGWAKLGIFLNKDGSRSFGNIFSVTKNNSSALLNNLNNRTWKGLQQSASYTGIYGSPDEEKWSIKAGVNIAYDKVSEEYKDSNKVKFSPKREEFSAGIFGELVYKKNRLLAVLGSRADYNNLYGNYLTPRLHIKYDLPQGKKLHLQAGMGRRTPWIFVENLPLLISNRNLVIETQNAKGAYGLNQEKAINSGLSYTQPGMAFNWPSTLTIDAFYTYFINQVVADRDADGKTLFIRNEKGNKTSIAQIEWLLKLHRRLDVKLSYRFVYSLMNTGGANRIQTMQSPHRVVFVANYQTRKKIYIDWITQVNSPKRLPYTQSNPEAFKRNNYSPWYTIINLQIRKEWKNTEVYLGCENLLNFYQKNPVLGSSNPTSPYFDAAFAYGPTMGRNLYAGMRWKLQ